MKTSLTPMFVSLALLTAGAATAQPTRPAADGSQTAHMPSAADIAMRHKQLCQDGYAHQVGDMAYLEARLTLTAAQQPLFDRWKNVKLDIAKRGAADCATRELPPRSQAKETPLDVMAREEDMLKRRIANLDTERPALGAFYNSLTAAQKMALTHPGPEPMMDRRRMFSQALTPGMGRRGDGMRGQDRSPGPDAPPQ